MASSTRLPTLVGTDPVGSPNQALGLTAETPMGSLVRQLGERFVVSVNPDHPYLFEGPDILAGGDGRLLAIFRPKSTELSNPNRLLSRLVLTKLALPNHTRYILVMDPERPNSKLLAEPFSESTTETATCMKPACFRQITSRLLCC